MYNSLPRNHRRYVTSPFIISVLSVWSSDFGGSSTNRGNTGPFWVGSGLAVLSALITFFFIRPLSHDGLVEEDRIFREYLEAHGYDTSKMGFVEEGDEWSEASMHEKDTNTKADDA
jgi:hypothetical protein